MEENIKKVPPMEQRRLVTYINNFITTTVSFLNTFLIHSEAKLMKSEERLQKISASLCILETKLNSVPDLRGTVSQQPISTNEPPVNKVEDVQLKVETPAEPIKTEDNGASKSVESSTVVDKNPKELTVDPVLLKYRKMLQFGVPRGAVELKMVTDGLDPKLL